MPYDKTLADRIRERLAELPHIEEKEMMGGLTFMYNDKMCVGVIGDEMMCRIDHDLQDEVLEKPGTRIMDFTNRPMKGYVLVDDRGMRNQKDFEYYIGLCLEFNSKAKSSKKKRASR
jgi:TfoX/Sxy family transcriptional regulator of competence genes